MRTALLRRQRLQSVDEVEGFARGQFVGAGLAQESLRGRFLRRCRLGAPPRGAEERQVVGEAPQQMLFAVEQIPQRPARSAAGLKDRAGAAWDWACRAAPGGLPEFPIAKAPARRARGRNGSGPSD